MLRRKPTAITLTSEDLSAYEDRQAREALLAAQTQAQAAALAQLQAQAQGQAQGLVTPQKTQNVNPNGEGRQAPAVEKKKTREERLGIAGRA
jgi:hypothetical protein